MKKYFLCLFLLIASQQVFSQTCITPLVLNYEDGEKGCLTDLPIAKIVDKSWGKSVAELAKTAAYYSIAASENCKIAKIGIASGNMGFLASKAEQSALIAHTNGQCSIKNGNWEDMYELTQNLISLDIKVMIQSHESHLY